MIRRTITMLAVLSAALGVTACEDEPEGATLVSDPILEEQRQRAAAPLAPEDLRTDDVTPAAAAEPGERVLSGVAVIGVDVECDEAAVFFETGAAELGPEDEQKLDQLASCLRGTPEQELVPVAGHTDPRASEEYNEELSRERAQAVADYLRGQGIADDRIEIRAMGEQGAVEGMPILWPAQRNVMVDPRVPAGD